MVKTRNNGEYQPGKYLKKIIIIQQTVPKKQ